MIRYGIKFIDNLVTDALVSIIKNIIQKCVRCFKHKPSDSSEVELFACAGMFWHAAKLTTQNNAATTNISFSIVFTIFLFFFFSISMKSNQLELFTQLNRCRSADQDEMLNCPNINIAFIICQTPPKCVQYRMHKHSKYDLVKCFDSHFNWITTSIGHKLDQLWRESDKTIGKQFWYARVHI